MLIASNKSLAEYNLSMEPQMTESRQKLAEKHREAVQAVETVRRLKAEVQEKSGTADADTLLAVLQVRRHPTRHLAT